MQSLLQYYAGNQVTQQAEVLAELLEEKFKVELTCLEHVSVLIEKEAINKEKILQTFEEMEHCSAMGLLELGGMAVYGESLSIQEFSGIQDSFHGNKAISYGECCSACGGIWLKFRNHRTVSCYCTAKTAVFFKIIKGQAATEKGNSFTVGKHCTRMGFTVNT